jgi:hypothetical protein
MIVRRQGTILFYKLFLKPDREQALPNVFLFCVNLLGHCYIAVLRREWWIRLHLRYRYFTVFTSILS